jgi:hypothetical protein
MKYKHLLITLLLAAVLGGAAHAQLVNLGLVAMGRLPANSFDQLGTTNDTLGGIFSGMWLDPATLVYSNGNIHVTIFALPDRGFGDGATDYHPRIQRLRVSLPSVHTPQGPIIMVNDETHVLTVNGSTFTGANPDDTNVLTHPQSLAGGIGGGKWSLDPEGIVFAPNGSWYISDEYGPFTYRFDNTGALQSILPLPDAYIPKIGPSYPRVVNYFTASTIATNDSGRYINRGMEGLSVTPDGKKLVAFLQSPLVQDGENRNPSRNVRILVYDVDPASASNGQPIAEYVHVLPLSAAEANNRHTPVSEILALSDKKFLILQRDSRGLGGDPGPLLYKRIVEVDATSATSILGTGYDLEKGAPGALALPRSSLPTNIVAVTSRDLVDLLNTTELAKFGLNTAASNQNINTLSEKWEGLGIVPLNDPQAPSDYLLLVGNDNDFRAPVVYHNGQPVGTNTVISDNMMLAFRIGADNTPPTIVCPAPTTVSAGTNCTATVDRRASVQITENSAAPVTVTQTPSQTTALGLGTHTLTLRATDAAGNVSEPCTTTVTVADTTAPTITCPTNQVVNATNASGAVVNYPAAVASDNCSSMVSLTYSKNAGTVFAIGTTNVTVTAMDEAGNTNTCTFSVQVKGALEQINDLIAKVNALPGVKSPNKKALLSPLQTALAALAANKTSNACSAIQAFINLVNAQADKKLISVEAAAGMITDATRIRAALGCP